MLGIKWDHKLQKWVVYEKTTGKILKKCESEKEAKGELSKLSYSNDEPYRRKI